MSAVQEGNFNASVTNGTVKSVYTHFDSLINAVHDLKKAGVKDMVVTAPLPRHEIEEQLYEGRPSPIRWFTLCGAIFGGVFGFSLCSFTHLNWAMIIPAGKPLVSIPAFMVITFESTVLWGCLFTLAGMLLLTRLPGFNLQVEVQDPRFSDDVFGLVVNNLGRKQAATVVETLHASGAAEVVNGYDVTPEGGERKVIPLEEMGVEPDEPNTGMLARIAIGVTIIIIAAVVGANLYFHKVVGDQLKAKGYSTTTQGVPTSERPNQ